MKSFGKFQEKLFSSVPFRQNELLNLPPMVILKTDAPQKLSIQRIFKIVGYVLVVESSFNRRVFSAFYNFVKNSITGNGMLHKVA